MSAIRIGDVAPDFMQNSARGPIDLHRWLGDGWGLLFCPTGDPAAVRAAELACLARLQPQFARRGVKALGIGADAVVRDQMRSVFVVDPRRRVRAIVGYPHGAGRNFAAVLGVIDALQSGDIRSVGQRKSPQGCRVVESRPRTTAQPHR